MHAAEPGEYYNFLDDGYGGLWLARNPKFGLVFQPAYCPWVNVIEQLWKALHDTVTRNHKHSTMSKLMRDVRQFLEACQPFTGAGHALAAA